MRTDVLIVGAGLAGLSCALQSRGSVVIVNDTDPARDVASAWAQGGLAAALGRDDSPLLHAADTIAAAAGIADARVVHALTAEAPGAVGVLEAFGVPFDRQADGVLALGLEAAHGRRRIVHAADHTGETIVRTLLGVLARRSNVTLLTGFRATDLLTRDDGRVTGGVFIDASGAQIEIHAGAVVLASGGYGGLYGKTTTPPATLGAGIALAARVGATLADLEFVQFHPTALASGADPMPLISEAVRGEGAWLVDETGARFVDELAPRDVVARAIFAVEERGGRAYLDARPALGDAFAEHFPTIARRCRAAGIDPVSEPIPVTAAAHYTIGGILTDGRGRTDVTGLWACGEVAATGLHGANRLASNSLMEAMIFGMHAADDIAATEAPRLRAARPAATPLGSRRDTDVAASLRPLRDAMTAFVGVVRDAAGLTRALDACDALAASPAAADPRVADALLVARAVALAALERRESRGAQYRRDYPRTDARLATRSFSSTHVPVAQSV